MDNGIFNSPVLACTQILIHTQGAQNVAAVLQTDLTQSLVQSVAQAYIKGVGLVLHKQRPKSELEATKGVNFLLPFKCIILQYKGQEINGSCISFPKK